MAASSPGPAAALPAATAQRHPGSVAGMLGDRCYGSHCCASGSLHRSCSCKVQSLATAATDVLPVVPCTPDPACSVRGAALDGPRTLTTLRVVLATHPCRVLTLTTCYSLPRLPPGPCAAACHMGGQNNVQPEKTLQKAALEQYLEGGFSVDSIITQASWSGFLGIAWEAGREHEYT